ncbi:MAG: hypothetical protein Q4B05_03125 [Candidatus Saccharibacteria bacterium]|nr:hypothetical protein [Candidatus Saccharibacteria bacterium]
MVTHVKRFFLAVVCLAVAGGLLIITKTTPSSAGPLGVLALFACIYVVSIGLTYGLLHGIVIIMRLSAKSIGRRFLLAHIPPLKLYYLSSVIGLAPVILLGMQSVGGIGLMDGVLLLLFEIIASFYVVKRF